MFEEFINHKPSSWMSVLIDRGWDSNSYMGAVMSFDQDMIMELHPSNFITDKEYELHKEDILKEMVSAGVFDG